MPRFRARACSRYMSGRGSQASCLILVSTRRGSRYMQSNTFISIHTTKTSGFAHHITFQHLAWVSPCRLHIRCRCISSVVTDSTLNLPVNVFIHPINIKILSKEFLLFPTMTSFSDNCTTIRLQSPAASSMPRSKTDVPFYAFKSSYRIGKSPRENGSRMPGSGTIWYNGQIKHP